MRVGCTFKLQRIYLSLTPAFQAFLNVNLTFDEILPQYQNLPNFQAYLHIWCYENNILRKNPLNILL